MIKKGLSLFAILIMTTASVWAADFEINTEYKNGTVTLSGTIDEARVNKLVSIDIKSADNRNVHLAFANTDDMGEFSYCFKPADENGDEFKTETYTVRVGAAGLDKPIEKPLEYSSPKQIEALIKELHAVDTEDKGEDETAAELLKIFDGKLKFFDVDDKYYYRLSEEQRKSICAALIGKTGSFDEISSAAEKAYAIVLLNTITKDEVKEVLSEYENIYKLQNIDIYNEYKSLSNTDRFDELFLKFDFKNEDNVKKAFAESTLLSKIASAQPGEIKKLFSTYESDFSFSLSEYEEADIDKIAYGIAGRFYASMDELRKAVDSLISESNNQNNQNNDKNRNSGGRSASVSIKGTSPQNTPQEDIERFSDLNGFEWARSSIEEMAKRDIISGVGDNRFEPGRVISREEFVKIVLCGFGLYDDADYNEISFDDVSKDDWAYPYIKCAYAKGVIKGVSDTDFGKGSPISREDMAVITNRAMKIAGFKLERLYENKEFSDSNDISDYAAESVRELALSGVINGFETGNFEPKLSATRAEAAVMINNVIKQEV